jgi:hypothetical protein
MARTLRKIAPVGATAAPEKEPARDRPPADRSPVVTVPVRLRASQLRVLEIAAEAAARRLGHPVSVSTIIAALITKYRSDLAGETDPEHRR